MTFPVRHSAERVKTNSHRSVEMRPYFLQYYIFFKKKCLHLYFISRTIIREPPDYPYISGSMLKAAVTGQQSFANIQKYSILPRYAEHLFADKQRSDVATSNYFAVVTCNLFTFDSHAACDFWVYPMTIFKIRGMFYCQNNHILKFIIDN